MLLARLLLVPVLLLAAVPADESSFVAGVLRRDGVVIPFASYDGKKWDSAWPEELRWIELPLTVDDVPERWWGKPGKPAAFTVWKDGKTAGSVRPQAPVMVPAACSRRIGLTTDYKASETPPPPMVRPYPKDGLAISGGQQVDPIAAVPPASPEWKAAEIVVASAFDRAEDRAIELFTDWKHPVKKSDRKKMPIEIEALYRAPMDEAGWVAYHVEAVRKYAPGKDDQGCGLITSATGWIGAGPERKQWTLISARVTYCDRKGVSYFLPLGLIRLRERSYWIYQTSGYEHERYYVARPTRRTTDLAVGYTAGSCAGF